MTTVWNLPLPTKEEPLATHAVSLDGATYLLRFDWNSRTDRWTLGISAEDGTAVISGILLQVGIDMLRTVPASLPGAPPGQLYLSARADPTQDGIDAAHLFYISDD